MVGVRQTASPLCCSGRPLLVCGRNLHQVFLHSPQPVQVKGLQLNAALNTPLAPPVVRLLACECHSAVANLAGGLPGRRCRLRWCGQNPYICTDLAGFVAHVTVLHPSQSPTLAACAPTGYFVSGLCCAPRCTSRCVLSVRQTFALPTSSGPAFASMMMR